MTTRRTFLTASAAALFCPRLARSANEEVRVAVLGPGGRGRWLTDRAAKLPGVRVVALCDVWRNALDAASKQQPDADRSADYRAVLDREDVDAVIIATPDHWHAKMTADAVAAGKHVYVEKPVTHARDDGAALVRAVRESGRTVQVGTQQRSMPHLAEAKRIVEDGTLGDLVFVRMTWNRNQPAGGKPTVDVNTVDWPAFCGPAGELPFDGNAMRQWRFHWAFGGGIFTDLMVHWVDTVQWMTGLPAATWAAATGSMLERADQWQTPDTVQCLLRFGDRPVQAHFAGTFSQHRERAMTELRGTKATLYIDRGRWELIPQKRSGVEARSSVPGASREKGSDFFTETDAAGLHIADWLAAAREGRDPATPIEAAVAAANTAHLANRSLRS